MEIAANPNLEEMLDSIRRSEEPHGLSIVILSKSASNLSSCILSICTHEPATTNIIVVDDGVDWREYGESIGGMSDLLQDRLIKIVSGVKPFVFARNANIGIEAAGRDDVVLLNDDALLQTPEGFSIMQKVASEWWPQTGILASTCNNVGNLAQHPRQIPPEYIGFRVEERMVCFVCVLLPRDTIDVIGPLDEQFVDYGIDDDDTCLTARKAGLGIAITDLVYVDHGSLHSEYRGGPKTGGDFRPNLRRFIAKWGVDNRGMSRAASPWADLF